MSPLRALLIAAWTGLVIYPTWGLWAVWIVLMGQFGLRVFFWPLDAFWRRVQTGKHPFSQDEIARTVCLRMIPPFIASFILMYLSVHWFSWWCFWAIFVTFVSIGGNDD